MNRKKGRLKLFTLLSEKSRSFNQSRFLPDPGTGTFNSNSTEEFQPAGCMCTSAEAEFYYAELIGPEMPASGVLQLPTGCPAPAASS